MTKPLGRRAFLIGAAAALKVGAVAVYGSRYWGRPAGAAGTEDEPGVHGMAMAGEGTVYLSHLPMFGSPHDYQVILEATFSKTGSDPHADYLSDRKKSGATLYTLEPERFVLPRLAAARPLRSFKASIYRGHFERFPTQAAKTAARVAQNVDVTVTRVVHFAQFDPAAAKPAELEYLLFGKGDDTFLAHIVTRPPDFDQIVSVKPGGHTFTGAELERGVRVIVPSRRNAPSDRIAGVEPVTAQMKGADEATGTVTLQPRVEVYFEQEELSS